jgi:glycosyltransferase involved in cell wall biosynthesis
LRWASRASGGVVAVSKPTRNELQRFLGTSRRIDVVANGVPRREGSRESIRRELAIGADEVLIVAVGNLYPVKGHEILLRALAGMAGVPPWRLAIAGRGQEQARLRALAEASGGAARVHLLGYRADVPDILAAADIFAMPSLSEGLPLAIIEAMFAARPIVASRVGGIPDAVEDGREGLLVAPGDSAALGHALERLLASPALRTSLGAAAQRRAEAEFTTARMTDRYEQIYRSLLGSPARANR